MEEQLGGRRKNLSLRGPHKGCNPLWGEEKGESGYDVFAVGGNEMERTSFDDGKQSAWPPMAVLAQKNPGSCPDPLMTGGNVYA